MSGKTIGIVIGGMFFAFSGLGVGILLFLTVAGNGEDQTDVVSDDVISATPTSLPSADDDDDDISPIAADPTPASTPIATPVPTPDPTPDTDADNPYRFLDVDGVPEDRILRSVCPDVWHLLQDTDGDGVPDAVEYVYGTDPLNPDTSGDGYTDGQAIRAGFDPLRADGARLDSDGDGLLDNEECEIGTDPFNPDTDGDGYTDKQEVEAGYNPLIPSPHDAPGTTPPQHVVDALPSPTPVPTPPADFWRRIASGTPAPTAPPQGAPTSPQGPSQPREMQMIPLSEFTVIPASSPADVRQYLQAIDSLRPAELLDGNVMASALESASQGNTQELSQVIDRIQRYEQEMRNVSIPQPAAEYHQASVSSTAFVRQQLSIIGQTVTTDQQRALEAAMDMQNILPEHVNRMQELRLQLEGMANQ